MAAHDCLDGIIEPKIDVMDWTRDPDFDWSRAEREAEEQCHEGGDGATMAVIAEESSTGQWGGCSVRP